MSRTDAAVRTGTAVTLALDTTTRAGSIAVYRHGTADDVFIGDATRSHGERLPGDIASLLGRAGVRIDEVDLFAVISGPGSFTGLRVGIAAIQGLALAREKHVVPIPALEAFAHAAVVPDGLVGVWMDAQRRQVFAALYDKAGDRLSSIETPVSRAPEDVIEAWRQAGVSPAVLIGDGVDLYAEPVRAAWPDARVISPAPPLAPIAAALAAASPHLAVAPHAIVPIYVRASDAEIARDRLRP